MPPHDDTRELRDAARSPQDAEDAPQTAQRASQGTLKRATRGTMHWSPLRFGKILALPPFRLPRAPRRPKKPPRPPREQK
eukprot:8612537-Pyramimonas_sp.AAC.1